MNLNLILIDPYLLLIQNSDGRGMQNNLEKGQSGLVPKKIKCLFFDGMEVFDDFPSWFTEEDLSYFVSQFEMSGFRGL